MKAGAKQALALFLDTAGDFLRDGHWQERAMPQWTDTEADAPPMQTADSLEKVAAEVRFCMDCRLCGLRILAVPGEGVSNPSVLVVGEAPGAAEDSSGRPFVGKAGQLLDKMLASIELSRQSNCFIVNTVKCRPPGNRDPLPDETAACARFFSRQFALLQPKAVLCVGRIAAQTLLKTNEGIGNLRGTFFDYQGRPLIATFHPSALLRDASLKRPAWEDLKTLKAKLLSLRDGNAAV
ncbi:MAG: uracil-DNA glycosylase [Treponema sp.]|jgi:DNA polymerase|nr:uracil-DNA glycosylase [Treponema sp.]